MSVVILGGNERMERRYKELCMEYSCQVKIFTKPVGSLKRKIGNPDLMIFFTGAMSHKMVQSALNEIKGTDTKVTRCASASMSALRGILEAHTKA